MRFFNRSIFGLFLTVLTIGILLAAVYVFKNAQDDRDDRKRPRTDRERSFSVYVLPIKIEAIKPVVFLDLITHKEHLQVNLHSGILEGVLLP